MIEHVVVLSEKSSGSSIFQEELAKHSKVHTVAWTPHTEAETLYWVKAANILDYPQEAFWEGRSPFPKWYCRRSIERILQKNLDTVPQAASDWDFLVQGWEHLARKFGPVFLEKSPHHLNQWPALACLLKFVEQTDLKIKVIGLVRNPLSVVYSTQQRWHSDVYKRQFMWEQSYRNLLAFKEYCPEDMFTMVRYEDLINSPKKEFGRILSFIGLDYEESIGKNLHANSLNKWESDKSFSFKIHPVVMEMGKRFGYTEEEMTCLKNEPYRSKTMLDYPRKWLFKLRSAADFYRSHVLR